MMEIALEENRDKDALNLINMLKSSSDNELSFLKNNKEFIKILDAYKQSSQALLINRLIKAEIESFNQLIYFFIIFFRKYFTNKL